MHNWHNHSAFEIITPPTGEPVTVADVRAHSRVDSSADDTIIGGYIIAARQFAERWQRKQLMTAGLRYTLDAFPYGDEQRSIGGSVIQLPRPPLQTVDSIQYINFGNQLVTWPSNRYIVDNRSQPGRIALIFGGFWPPDVLPVAGAVTVNYHAGYGDASAVLQTTKLAIAQLVAHWYLVREPLLTAGANGVCPFHVEALLNLDCAGTYP